MSGTSELLVIQFEQYGITAQSIALFQCTHVYIHMHSHAQTYTHYTPAIAVSGTF